MPDELNTTNAQTEQPADTGTQHGQETPPAWLPQRLAEERAAAQRKVLKELGFDDAKAVKAALEEANRLKQAQMTEAEKTAAALATLQKELESARAEKAQLETARKLDRVQMAIREAAQEARAHNPQAVIALFGDIEPLLEGETPNEKQIAARIEALRKSDPYLFGTGGVGSPSNRGGAQPATKALPALTDLEREYARLAGMTDEQYAELKR